MPRSTTRITFAALGTVAAVLLLGASIVQAAPGVPVATTLDSPRGLAALPNGDIFVAQAGTGQLLRILPDGTQQTAFNGFPIAASVPNGPLESPGVSAVTPDGAGGYFAIVGGSGTGFGSLYSVSAGGVKTVQLDMAAYEQANNTDGGQDGNGNPDLSSRPYDVVADVFGAAHVSDSAANAIIRHQSGGAGTPFFVFPKIPNPLYPQQGPQSIGQMPTGMTVGPDGAIYVATFTAPPYPIGEARVYRLKDGNFDGDAQDNGEWSVYATGLTAATDVAFDSQGRLFVSEYSTDMSTSQPGRISRIVNGKPVTEVHLLTTPTSLVITPDDRMIVTEESIGRIADVSSVSSGGFGSAIGPGVNLTTYAGGSVDQLALEASNAGANAVAVTSAGKFIVLVPGAPSFVNAAFKARFPGGVPAGTVVLVVGP